MTPREQLDAAMKRHAKAYDALVTEAKRLAAQIVCTCGEPWTSRGWHDPSGCTWQDLTDLRRLDEEHEQALVEWREAVAPLRATPKRSDDSRR